jgi:hypothetical protein
MHFVERAIAHLTTMPSFEPYDESTIVSLWTEVYRLQEALAYFPASDSVIYAPPEGHAINLDLCERLQLSPAVVSLLKRLPYPKDDWIAKEWPIIQKCPAVVYTDDNALFVTRDPEKAPIIVHKDEIRLDYLKPSELALTLGTADDAGTSIILDTDSSMSKLLTTIG